MLKQSGVTDDRSSKPKLGEGGNQADPPPLISEAFQALACSLSVSRLPLKQPL